MEPEAIAVEVGRLVDVCDEVPHSRLCHVRVLRFVSDAAEVLPNSEPGVAQREGSSVGTPARAATSHARQLPDVAGRGLLLRAMSSAGPLRAEAMC
jgi:hypothetical protein